MSYKRTVWENNKTPVNADNMNNIEEGIAEAKESSESARTSASNALSRANQAIQQAQNTANNASYLIDQTNQNVEEINLKLQNLERSNLTHVYSIEYLDGTGILTILFQDGTTKTVDLGIEKVATNLEFDTETASLVLTLADGTKQYIPISSLITTYKGSDGATIKIDINRDNTINAELKGKTITETHLIDEVANKLNKGFEAHTKVSNIETAYVKKVEEQNGQLVITSQDGTTKIIEVSTRDSFVKDVAFNHYTGIFEFTLKDGSKKIFDLAIEKVVTNFSYDSENKTLVLTLADGTTQNVPLTDLVRDYEGVENDQIQINIHSKNKIEAVLKDNSITYEKLSDDVKERIAAGGGGSNEPSNNTTCAISVKQIIVDEFSILETDKSPYTHFANVTITSLTDVTKSIELINDNPVLFAKYGFAIASVNGNTVELYSIGKPEEDVTLKFEIYKAYSVWDGTYTEE